MLSYELDARSVIVVSAVTSCRVLLCRFASYATSSLYLSRTPSGDGLDGYRIDDGRHLLLNELSTPVVQSVHTRRAHKPSGLCANALTCLFSTLFDVPTSTRTHTHTIQTVGQSERRTHTHTHGTDGFTVQTARSPNERVVSCIEMCAVWPVADKTTSSKQLTHQTHTGH